MKKQSIVIASVLKPVNDTRMFEKMGRSLAKTNQWSVHIIGFGDVHLSGEPNIAFLPLGSFHRISVQRVFAPFKFLKILFRIKPSSVIITTHELLLGALLYKLLTRTKIFYDVQENYFLNILNTKAYPFWVRYWLAMCVRVKENISSPFIESFILAEKCYVHELPFVRDRYSVVENKCQLPESFERKPNQHGIRLLFSGTLDESTGVFEAIELAKQLNTTDPSVHLYIVGYCSLAETRKKLLEAIKNKPFISMEGLDRLVEHKKIFEELSRANAGIIYYPNLPHTINRIPTKFYEYSACQIPILFDRRCNWSALAEELDAGIAIDFCQLNAIEVLKVLKQKPFYTRQGLSPLWETEEKPFLTILS